MRRLAMTIPAFLMLSLLTSARQQAPQSNPPSPDGKSVLLPTLLWSIGEKCGCVFTIEEAWQGNEPMNSMEVALVPKDLLNQRPQIAMDELTAAVPNFSYKVDSIDSRIIHIKDRRLANIERSYGLDDLVGPLNFTGRLADLVHSIAAGGVPITEKGSLSFNALDAEDRHTIIHVEGGRMTVRTALTNFFPLDTVQKGKILWIARTELDTERKTSVLFPL